jgi:hypothetical protein
MKILTNPIFDWQTCVLESAAVSEYEGAVVHCGGKGNNAPPPPDPYATANAQTGTNKETAAYNNALLHGNTFTPLGAQTYTSHVDPVTGATIYDANVLLAPDQQKLLTQQNQQNLQLGDTAQGMLGQVQNSYKNPLDVSGLPALQSGGPMQTSLDYSKLPALLGANDLQGAAKQVSDALYNQQASYLDPQYSQADTATRTRLANQGITQGSEAWNNAIDAFNRDKAFNYGQARNSAISGGIGALDTLGHLSLADRQQMQNEINTQGGFANQATQAVAEAANRARSQGIQEQFALRNQPLNEFNALRSASPVSVPQFNTANTSTTNPADISGNIWNAYQGNLNNYNQQQASSNNFLSGLFGLGSAAILHSDVRLKTDVEPVGTIGDGIGLYDFRYKGSPEKYTGVLAQEVERVHPEDVITTRRGTKAVDVAAVLAKQVMRHGR